MADQTKRIIYKNDDGLACIVIPCINESRTIDEIAKKEDCKAMIDYLSKSKTELKNLTEQKVCFWKSHRLFGVAFLENPDPSTLIQVDHINDDKYDYSLNNLRWLSVSDNIKDSRGTLEKKDSELF